MLVATEAGSSYSQPEYASWLKEAGFTKIRRIRLDEPAGLMVAVRRPGFAVGRPSGRAGL